jgi:glycosyltransferase involved in cell wall biosynthesis
VSLLDSLVTQTQQPDEIVIVDGGSTDSTVRIIRAFIEKNKSFGKKIQLHVKPGNRSIGRNYGVEKASGDIILFSDAGCILDKKWVKEVTKPFENKETEVVAGYYKGRAETLFQKCLIPYVLVMADRVDPDNFLPATRSMTIKKETFERLRGFNEKLSHNEDYAFARMLKKEGISLAFQKSAIVYWIPRNSLGSAFTMFKRFAYGDIEARIVRPKVIVLFGRYTLCLIVFLLSIVFGSSLLLWFLAFCLVFYVLWSIQKNYRYIKDKRAFFYLPLIQFTADIAVMSGSIAGFIAQYKHG